jgi:mediator of replication checkpoint protein 1
MSTTAPGTSTAPQKPRTKLLSALRRSDSSDSSESSAGSASDGSDVESVPTRSPYKLQPQRRSPASEVVEDDEEVDAESAYQRMRRRLAAEKASQEHEAQKPIPALLTAIESEDDEDIMPVQKPFRRPAAAKQRSSSPRTSRSPNVQSRQSSPGLFVSPGPSPAKQRTAAPAANGSDSDHSSHPASATDLQERVRRIRAERLAKQKEEAEKIAIQMASGRASGAGAGSDDEAEIDRRLTQQSKPTRRAGKKALEAMARDQQRISRNMQLAHQAKTKKKYSTKDLFAKFGFNAPSDDTTTGPPTPELVAALASSDVEAQSTRDTPPTSPPQQDDVFGKTNVNSVNTTPRATVVSDIDDMTPVPTKVDKGKGRAPAFAHLPTRSWPRQGQVVTVQHAQIQSAKPVDDAMVELSDSDDESNVTLKSRFAVFDRIRTREQDESKSFVTLRHLAHLTSSKDSRKGPKTISRNEMNFGLAQKARLQAQRSREEKIEELKRRGIHVETAEEREKHQMEVEDLVAQFEKQRQEDLKLAKLEKKEAKANGQAIDELPSSDEDEDYVGSDEETVAEDGDEEQEEGAEEDMELSGFEDEQMEDADASNDLIDGSAEEDADAEVEAAQTVQVNDLMEDDEDESVPLARKSTSKRARRVVDDEDESSDEAQQLGSPTQEATQVDAKSAFGFGVANPGLGLTQMFAGTMANLDDSQATSQEPEQDSLDFLRSLPDTQPPGVTFSQTHDTLVPNSQLFVSPRKASQPGVESQFSLNIGQLVAPSPSRTQFSEAPEPTQDVGFSFSRSPAGFRAPDSTVETVMMAVAESPLKQRSGRLQRGRREATVELSDAEENLDGAISDLSDVDDIQRPPKHRDAFRAMQKGAKKQKAIVDFNKKNSAAKNIVEEQADESEDEYAGIGGASDDDSGEEDEDLKDMIDHADVKVDERKMAAFYA